MMIFIDILLVGWIFFEIFYYYRKISLKAGAKRLISWSLQLGLDFLLACVQIGLTVHFFIRQFEPEAALPKAAVFLMIFGLLLRWYAIQILGKYHTAEIAVFQGHPIIEAGPYKLIRHPQYLGRWVTFLGASLLFSHYFSGLIWGTALLVLGIKIYLEEKELASHWGIKFRNYQQRTWLIIPYLI